MYGFITCYRCGGEGVIYKYEGSLGDRKECPGCYGRGSLYGNNFYQCIKCKGKGQVYEYDDDLGQRYQCPICKNLGYTQEKYLECPQCKGGGRVYPFQAEKLGVPKGCIPCNALGYIKEKDYYNINFNQYNYYYNKPIDPSEAGKYTIHRATQGQFNPLENRNMQWQKLAEEEYSVGKNDIYGEEDNRQGNSGGYYNNSQHQPQQQYSGYNNNYNNNYNDNYNNKGMVNSGNIYNSQSNQNYNNNYNVQSPGGYPNTQVDNVRNYQEYQNAYNNYYNANNNYNGGYY